LEYFFGPAETEATIVGHGQTQTRIQTQAQTEKEKHKAMLKRINANNKYNFIKK